MPTIGTATVNLQAETASFKAALREAAATTRETAQEMRASMMEARGSITLLGEEIGVHLPRHLRNFVATLPGVAPLMSAAFSTIAVAGLGVVVLDVAKKIYEFAKSLGEVSKAEKQRHDQFVKDAREELGFQTKLIEAQFELEKSMAKTPEERQRIQVREDTALLGLNADYRKKLEGDLESLKELQQQARETAAAMREVTPMGFTEATGMGATGEMMASVKESQAAGLQQLMDARDKDIQLAGAALKSDQAKLNNDLNRINETGAKDAEAAAKKAAAAQMRSWEDEFARERSLRVMSLGEEEQFWMDRLRAASAYAENYRAVMTKIWGYGAAAQVQLQAEMKRSHELQVGMSDDLVRTQKKGDDERLADMERLAKETLDYLKQEQAFAQRAVAPGGEAAMQDMAQQLNYLNELKGTESDTLGVEMARKQLLQQIAALENQQVLATGSVADGMKVWMNEMKTQWSSSAQQTHDLFTKAFEGIGQNLAQMLVTGKAHWASFFQSIATDLAQLAINDAFKMLLNWGTGGAGGGGFLSGLMQMFGGAKASGGDLDAGHFYIAGEAGPEIISGVNGRAFDAGTSAKMLGSGSGAMYYVDARGTNPADTEARMQQALIAVHGSAVRTSYGVVQEAARRRPLSMQTA